MNNITKPSRRFAVLFRTIFFLYPVGLLLLWLWVDPSDQDSWMNFELTDWFMEGIEIQSLEMWQRLACFAASMMTGGAVMYVFHNLSRLFGLYASGEFFGAENVSCYRGIGIGLIVQQILSLPEGALMTALLTLTRPEGERMVAVSIDDTNISLVVVGLMVIIISRIMDEGRKMQEEQRLTV